LHNLCALARSVWQLTVGPHASAGGIGRVTRGKASG